MTRARLIGFLISAVVWFLISSDMGSAGPSHWVTRVPRDRFLPGQCERSLLTRDCAYCTTSTKVVDDSGITLHSSIHGQITAIACVRDLSILQNHNGHLDGVCCVSSIFQYGHCDLGGILTSREMMLLVGKAMKAGSSMDEDRRDVTTFTMFSERHRGSPLCSLTSCELCKHR